MLNLNILLMYLIIFSIFYNMTKIKESEIFFMIISLSYIPFCQKSKFFSACFQQAKPNSLTIGMFKERLVNL